MARITENDILIPALYIIYKNSSANTSTIKNELIDMFNPTGKDAEILSGRNDIKFTQIVRNLTGSHYATNKFGELTKKNNGKFKLTDEGKKFVLDNIKQCEYISNNSFSYDDNINIANKIHRASDKKHSLITYREDTIINEGKIKSTNSKIKSRSEKLRKAAIDYYKDANGHLRCQVCGFDFEETYGELGKEYIQIHHEHPVCQYDDEGVTEFIKDAIKNVKPLCANCHCMIHRYKKNQLTIEQLKILLK